MREILFRAYDKTMKRYKPFDGEHDTMLISRDGKIDYYNLQNGSGFDEYILEQFTGLTDKNGKKIFEGDIIEVDFDNDSPTIGKQKAFIEYSQHYTAFMVRPIKDWAFCEMTEGRVIGNIHDNTELLS